MAKLTKKEILTLTVDEREIYFFVDIPLLLTPLRQSKVTPLS
jgi:hypothetical protein